MTKPGPKRDRDAERRILDATRDLICARGAAAVSINQIAAEAEVGKQTIYRWWPSKAAVIVDSLNREIGVNDQPPDTGSARGDIRVVMQRFAKLMKSPMGSILRELIIESFGDEEVAEQFRTMFFAERRRRGAAAIRGGIERGELRGDLDVEIAVDLVCSPLWMRMIVGHQPLTPRAVDALLDQVWPALVAGD